MKRLRILVLMHKDLVPPEPLTGQDVTRAEWKTEYDVVSTLRQLGHDVTPLGVKSDLGVLRTAIEEGSRTSPSICSKSSMGWRSTTKTSCRIWNSCTCPIPAVTRAG